MQTYFPALVEEVVLDVLEVAAAFGHVLRSSSSLPSDDEAAVALAELR